MLQQRVLDLARADLVAAALDQVGRPPPDDADVAVGVAHRHVAGPEPAVPERRRRRVRPVQVLQEQVRPAHLDLADRSPSCRRRRPCSSTTRTVDAVHRQPDRARPAIAVEPHADVHQRLAHPVPLDDALTGGLRDPLVVARGQRRRAGDQQPRARGTPRPARWSASTASRDPVVHRRDAEHHRGAGSPARGRWPRPRTSRAAPNRRSRSGPRTPMTSPCTWNSGSPCTSTSSRGPLPRLGQRVEVRGQRAPGQHDALGRPGRAGGVDDQRGRLRSGFDERRPAAPNTIGSSRSTRSGVAVARGCAPARARRAWG